MALKTTNDIIVTPVRGKLRHVCEETTKDDTNTLDYSKYIPETDAKRVAYAFHRLLHNYVMFKCEDQKKSENLINEVCIQKVSEGIEKFFIEAYLYDPWYQPISFEKQYGYIEVHVKIGIGDKLANKDRIFKKMFLIVFYKGQVRYVLTKSNKPGRMVKTMYKKAVDNKCDDVWCRVDFITSCVPKRYRKIRSTTVEGLLYVLSDDKRSFKDGLKSDTALWTVIDFDTDSENWSSTEKNQFLTVMREKSTPYDDKNLLEVAELEKHLTKKRKRKRIIIKEN